MECSKCLSPATVRFSPDIDIQGLGACEQHKDDVQFNYMLLLGYGGPELEIKAEKQNAIWHNQKEKMRSKETITRGKS